MKLVSTIVGFVLFVLFFGFALKNTHLVELNFFLGQQLQWPLALILLAFFSAGAFLGILALAPTVFRHRRENSKHKTTIEALQNVARQAPDSITTGSHGL